MPDSVAAAAVPVAERIWRRFTPAQRLARFTVYLAIVAAIVVSLRHIEIIPEFLYDAPEQVVDLLTRMWPIEWAAYRTEVHASLVETLHIASLGTLLSLVLALPVGVLAAHNLVPFTPVNLLAKLILVSSRSVNSLVWALLFVGIFGPGALAGTLAIAFRSIDAVDNAIVRLQTDTGLTGLGAASPATVAGRARAHRSPNMRLIRSGILSDP